MKKKSGVKDDLEIPTFLLRGHPDCIFNNPAPVRSGTGPKARNQEKTIMAKKAKAVEAVSYEGKSISELVTIYNEKADALEQPHRSSFKNAAAGIKAIQGLELTAATTTAKPTKPAKEAKAKKTPTTPKSDAEPRGQFGERPSTNKGKLIALLVKNAGKKVKITAAEQMLYGETGTTAIAGVIFGATAAFAAHGGSLTREGKGADATLTYSPK